MFLYAVFLLSVLPFSASYEMKVEVIEVQVKTNFGDIVGIEQTNTDDSKYYMFQGVPYAKPPVRFKDSEPWTDQYDKGVFKAMKTKRCIQHLPHGKDYVITGEEDCLHLNIYTPIIPTVENTANYDVVVFIHGGAFVYGSGHAQTPEYLLLFNKELVFVSINYRLGPFGFLCTEDVVVPGNMGLKDQVLALRWVKENIHHFGGDPNKVMISGMSAGAISVHLHYMSPLSRDLFARGVSMSGVALSPLIKTKDERKGAEYLAGLMKCPVEKSEEMVGCLRDKNAQDILKSIAEDDIPWKLYNAYAPFGPVIDKYSQNPFLDEHPYFILRGGKVMNVPWMVSATTAEGLKPGELFIDDQAKVNVLNEKWEEIAPYLLMFKHSAPEDKLNEISHRVSQHYLRGNPIQEKNRAQVIKLIGDRIYMTSIENSIRLHARACSAPVYLYKFGFRGQQSFSTVFSRTPAKIGASHIDDMIYILKMKGFDPLVRHPIIVKRMVGVWTSFMTKEVPVASPHEKTPWPRIQRGIVIKGDLDFMYILDYFYVKVISKSDLSNRNFWDRLPLDELHVSGDRRVPSHIKSLQKKTSSLKYKLTQVLGKVIG